MFSPDKKQLIERLNHKLLLLMNQKMLHKALKNSEEKYKLEYTTILNKPHISTIKNLSSE